MFFRELFGDLWICFFRDLFGDLGIFRVCLEIWGFCVFLNLFGKFGICLLVDLCWDLVIWGFFARFVWGFDDFIFVAICLGIVGFVFLRFVLGFGDLFF